jgi:hypothetical protein
VRRLRRKMPQARILVCCWGRTNTAMTRDHLNADAVADNLGEAAVYCLSLVEQTAVQDNGAGPPRAVSRPAVSRRGRAERKADRTGPS